MNRTFLSYPEWQPTADTLHMYLQIIGKIKLMHCYKRPEWAHVRLHLTVDGLTTGIIPGREAPFDILVDLRKHRVELRSTSGKFIFIPLMDDLSVASFYKEIMKALQYIGTPTQIDIHPQEFYDPIDFDKDEKHRSYDEKAILLFLENLHFAYKSLVRFMSPFRGKVNFPAYYFGTMDLSSTVYSGVPAPFEGKDKITLNAFDEQCCEFGFWPGDPQFTSPSFYVLPYPFISEIQENRNMIKSEGAYFSSEKKEFFFTLENAFNYEEPVSAVTDFFSSCFDILQKLDKWKNIEWINTPLGY